MKSKFDFYEIVKIVSNKLSLKKINGKFGVVRGKSQSEDNPSIFAYAVSILNQEGEVVECWNIFEEDLQPTGKKSNPAKHRTGQEVKVYVDPKTGKGKIIDQNK